MAAGASAQVALTTGKAPAFSSTSTNTGAECSATTTIGPRSAMWIRSTSGETGNPRRLLLMPRQRSRRRTAGLAEATEQRGIHPERGESVLDAFAVGGAAREPMARERVGQHRQRAGAVELTDDSLHLPLRETVSADVDDSGRRRGDLHRAPIRSALAHVTGI